MKAKVEPAVLTHRTVADLLSVDTETLREWVAKGEWPEPHAVIERTWFYKRSVIEHWLETGEWLTEAKFKKGEGRGRDS